LSCCKECRHILEDIEVEAYEKRQVFDIPPVNLIVTEHRSQIKTCPHYGRLNKADFPKSVKYPVQYGPNILASAIYCKNHHFIPCERISELFNDVIGIKICSATIIKAERECFRNMEYFENTIREKLISSPVLHCDETGMKVQGKKHWLHVASNDKYTCYFAHPKGDQKQRILWEFFQSIREWQFMMDRNPTMVMIVIIFFVTLISRENLLELKSYKQQWTKEMNELLTEMKKYTDECKEQVKDFDIEQIKALEKGSML